MLLLNTKRPSTLMGCNVRLSNLPINCSCILCSAFTFLQRISRCVIHCVSKNSPTLTSCSFNKHGLILIIFGQQHQRCFGNDMHIQLFLSLNFYLLYLLLNSCDGNDAKQHVFLVRLLVALKECVGPEKCRF